MTTEGSSFIPSNPRTNAAEHPYRKSSTSTRKEVSRHEVAVFEVLRGSNRWLSNQEITAEAKDVSARTVRLHTKRFVELGLVDVEMVFPGYRYRWSKQAGEKNADYVRRLERAATIFSGLPE